jgi:plasmid stabilization system protein ParE
VNVSYSPAASADLEEIEDDLAATRSNPERAFEVYVELLDAIEEIGQTPFAFRRRIEVDGRWLRMRPKGAYNIYYTVDDDGARIQRIIPLENGTGGRARGGARGFLSSGGCCVVSMEDHSGSTRGQVVRSYSTTLKLALNSSR